MSALKGGERGGLSVTAAVETVRSLRSFVVAIRDRRERMRGPGRTIREIVADDTRAAIERAAHDCFRQGVWGTTRTVHLGGEPSYEVHDVPNWRRNQRYPQISYRHVIRVSASWLLRVRPIGGGAGVCAGRLVLDANLELREADGRAIYSAVVARQGRGCRVVVEEVFLAVSAEGQVRAFP